MDQEKVFFEGSERKEAFLEQKKHQLKKPPKIFIFSKRLVHGFCQKMEIFLMFSFYAKWIKKKCFFKVPKEKKPFQSKRTSA